MARLLRCLTVMTGFVLIVLANSLYAQASNECSTYCQNYMSCDEQCSICTGGDDFDFYCAHWYYSTCGQSGMSCGGCATFYTWSDETVIGEYDDGGGCGQLDPYTNQLVQQHVKQIRHRDYEHVVCAGVASDRVVNDYTFNRYCWIVYNVGCVNPIFIIASSDICH